MTVKIQEMLGSGIYTVQEAALYARVSPQMMSRWLFGNSTGKAVIDPQFASHEKLVSFLDLVQTLAIREIRLQKRVKLSKFREAIKVAKEKFKMSYPFAMRHCAYLWGEDIVISPPNEGYVEASGKHQGQRLFKFVELYLTNLSFDAKGLANNYTIYSHQDIGIHMKPTIRFGEPMLPSGYSAKAIWDSIGVEGGIDETAKAFGIPREEVEASYRLFVDCLGKTAA